jgi:hypothetical protein
MKYALFLFLLTGSSVFAGHDLSRYEIIMDRKPFGNKPPSEEQADPAKPAGEFAKQYRLCTLYKGTTGQLKAGIVSKVNNKNIFLQVGESEKGLSLVEVRLEEGIAVLRQGDETAQLILEGLGTPLVTSVSQQVAMNPVPAGVTPAQIIRRGGVDAVPEHILDALKTSAPKQAQITIRKTRPVVSAGASSGSSDASGLSDSLTSTVNRPTGSSEKANVEAAQARALSNYVVQSVPLYIQKNLLAKGL